MQKYEIREFIEILPDLIKYKHPDLVHVYGAHHLNIYNLFIRWNYHHRREFYKLYIDAYPPSTEDAVILPTPYNIYNLTNRDDAYHIVGPWDAVIHKIFNELKNFIQKQKHDPQNHEESFVDAWKNYAKKVL